MSNQDLIYNYNKAWRLYSEGIKHQMNYESAYECIEELSEEDAQLLESIKETNQKLYNYIKSLLKELP